MYYIIMYVTTNCCAPPPSDHVVKAVFDAVSPLGCFPFGVRRSETVDTSDTVDDTS
jgi:hypothetical protein